MLVTLRNAGLQFSLRVEGSIGMKKIYTASNLSCSSAAVFKLSRPEGASSRHGLLRGVTHVHRWAEDIPIDSMQC